MSCSKVLNNQHTGASAVMQKSQEARLIKLLIQARYKQYTLEHHNHFLPKGMDVPELVKSALPEFTSIEIACNYIIRFIEIMAIVEKEVDPILIQEGGSEKDYCNIINLIIAFHIGINISSFLILKRAYDQLLQQGQRPQVENVLHMLTVSIY